MISDPPKMQDIGSLARAWVPPSKLPGSLSATTISLGVLDKVEIVSQKEASRCRNLAGGEAKQLSGYTLERQSRTGRTDPRA